PSVPIHVPRALLIALLVAIAGRASAAPPAAKPAAGSAAKKSGTASAKFDIEKFKPLEWRSIGPANMGGRISDIAAVESDPARMFLATATGGVWKTQNMGATWTPVFDKEAVSSTGAVAVFQPKPDIVWVGTGEANNRNSSGWGRGVYRSDDGGGSWKLMGLEATASIGRVITHPTDSLTVYVAALGRLWGANAERGVFMTRDGGRTWSHVLKVDANTGCVDLAMDPKDPSRLYAAMYSRRRTPWSYTGISETGGIWRSTD